MQALLPARITAAAAVIALAACGGSVVPGVASRAPIYFRSSARGINKIQHIVIIVQENRSLDNLFQGFPGARTRSYGYDTSGDKIKLEQVPLEIRWDVDHSAQGFFA